METCFLLLLTFSATAVTEQDTILCLIVLGPYPDDAGMLPDWDGGPALIPAARLAAEVINNRTDVLPGYKLHLLEGDSGCNVQSKTAISLAKTLYDTRPSTAGGCAAVVGIVGPACSEATAVVGDLIARDGSSLLHLSPSATSPELNIHPNTFRLVSSSEEYVNLYGELIDYNEWDNIAALYDSSREYFQATFFEFRDKVNITYSSPVSADSIPLSEIYLHHKVIFLFVGAEMARKILCMAYQHKPPLVFPVYQWIFHDRTEEQLWQNVSSRAGRTYSCSRQQMMHATDGVILNLYRLKREDESAETDVGMTLSDFYFLYEQQLSRHLEEIGLTCGQFTPTAEDWAPLYYDSVWAMALALTKAETDLLVQENITLSGYRFGKPRSTSLIKRQLCLLDFEGLSGRILIRNATRDTAAIIDMYQVRNNASPYHIGSYGPNGLKIEPNVHFEPSSFEIVQEYVHPVATVIVSILIILCTGFLGFLHVLSIYHYNSSPIRASSPRLSQLVYSGCYLIMLMALCIAAISSKWVVTLFEPLSRRHFLVYGVFCCIDGWLISSGYTLILSTLVVQFWRIYNIFNNSYKHFRFLSDEYLVCFVIFILALNVTVQLVWVANDTPTAEFMVLDTVESYGGSREPVTPLRFMCTFSPTERIYDAVVIGINSLLTLSLVALTVLNTQIRKKEFSSSGMSVQVYIFLLVTAFASVITSVLGSNDLLFVFLVWEFCFLSSVLAVSVFIFLPGVYKSMLSHHPQ